MATTKQLQTRTAKQYNIASKNYERKRPINPLERKREIEREKNVKIWISFNGNNPDRKIITNSTQHGQKKMNEKINKIKTKINKLKIRWATATTTTMNNKPPFCSTQPYRPSFSCISFDYLLSCKRSFGFFCSSPSF